MVNGFNFNKVQRRYFNVTLKNGKTYLVAMPEKATFETLVALESAAVEDVIDDLYECVAKIISNNKQGYRVKMDDIKEYNFDEIMQFIGAYTDFIQGLKNEKN